MSKYSLQKRVRYTRYENGYIIMHLICHETSIQIFPIECKLHQHLVRDGNPLPHYIKKRLSKTQALSVHNHINGHPSIRSNSDCSGDVVGILLNKHWVNHNHFTYLNSSYRTTELCIYIYNCVYI